MKATKFQFNDYEYIKVEFPYDPELIRLIKQIEGVKWNPSLKSWLLPYTDEAYNKLLNFFPEIQFNNSKLIQYKPSPVENSGNEIENPVSIEVIGRKILIQLSKNEVDIQFLRSLRFSKWNKNIFRWEIPDFPGNLDLLNDYFGNRVISLIIHSSHTVDGPNGQREAARDELLIFKTLTGRLKLIFGFNKALTAKIKQYPYHSWNAKNKWWTIPYSDHYLEELKAIAEEVGLKVTYEEEIRGEKGVNRVSPYDVPNYRYAPEEYILKLTEMRYSDHTIRTYKALFEEFMNYYHNLDIKQIDEHQIIAFLRYLVMERKVSISYQNQAINAIKYYYEKVLGGKRKFYFIDRPKKEKTLPTVLNEVEIVCLLKTVENKKHKTILMLAYSSGLRLGEIIRLKLTDIDRQRMQIRIEQSKGKKDRYTKLSAKFLNTLDEYLEEYNPKEYVIEGAKGEDYSPRSIQNMIKNIASKAHISKRVTMHTLRHTFATHSLENGVDLRYIQSMMGHESSKTTEVYTHITTRGFDQIQSPMDNLDI